MAKGNIYWFTGNPSSGKTVLGKKLVKLLQTERRNWRKDVFHIDGSDFSDNDIVDNIKSAQLIAEYLYENNCDVVVSLESPYKELREEFKEKIGLDNFKEFYIHSSLSESTTDYTSISENLFKIDTTKDNPDQSFTKIVNYLRDGEDLL